MLANPTRVLLVIVPCQTLADSPAVKQEQIPAQQPALKIGNGYFLPHREYLTNADNTLTTRLTSLEASLLIFMHRHAGITLTRDAIAIALYGHEHDPRERRIDMQINRLRKKLNTVTDASHHLHTVWRKGYRLTL